MAVKNATRLLDTFSVTKVLLKTDLGFHGSPVGNGRHNLHAFAAKFPPELPRFFIEALTKRGDIVLDPMAGSGTTLVEASMLGRRAIGIDRDPPALLVSNVKLSKHDTASAKKVVERALQRAEAILYTNDAQILRNQILQESSPRTVEFIDYWFFPQTQVQLWTLASAI